LTPNYINFTAEQLQGLLIFLCTVNFFIYLFYITKNRCIHFFQISPFFLLSLVLFNTIWMVISITILTYKSTYNFYTYRCNLKNVNRIQMTTHTITHMIYLFFIQNFNKIWPSVLLSRMKPMRSTFYHLTFLLTC